MISLIPSPTLPLHRAKGHPGTRYRDNALSKDVRQYPAEKGIAEEEALARGMEEKSNESADAGSEVYVPA